MFDILIHRSSRSVPANETWGCQGMYGETRNAFDILYQNFDISIYRNLRYDIQPLSLNAFPAVASRRAQENNKHCGFPTATCCSLAYTYISEMLPFRMQGILVVC